VVIRKVLMLIDFDCDEIVTEVLDTLKKELLIFLEYLNTVKLWIQLNVPRIEDGNNFGVGIQVS
jgi:hypothetical protein